MNKRIKGRIINQFLDLWVDSLVWISMIREEVSSSDIVWNCFCKVHKMASSLL